MSVEGGLSREIGPAAVVALPQAAAEDDDQGASLWCARLARFGMVEPAAKPAVGRLADLMAETGRADESETWRARTRRW